MKRSSRLLSLVLLLAVCLSLGGVACAAELSDLVRSGEKAALASTVSFLDELDEAGLPYQYRGWTDSGDEEVIIDYPGNNCEHIYIGAFFGPDGDDVYFRVWNLIDFNSSDYRELLGKVNDLNSTYNFVSFVLDNSDFSVTVELDALLPPDGGELSVNYLLLLGRITDKAYLVLEPYAKA